MFVLFTGSLCLMLNVSPDDMVRLAASVSDPSHHYPNMVPPLATALVSGLQ